MYNTLLYVSLCTVLRINRQFDSDRRSARKFLTSRSIGVEVEVVVEVMDL